MKRKWAYLGAAFPLATMATTPGHAAIGEPSDDMGWKKKQPAEDDGEESLDPGSAQDGADNAGHGAETSSNESTSDSGGRDSNTGSGSKGSGGLSDDLNGSGVSPVMSPAHGGGSDGMYDAPSGSGGASGGAGIATGGGRNVEQTTDETTDAIDTSAEVTLMTDPSTYINDPSTGDDTGYVEPDLADADAMLILLGGAAIGSGDGATTTGEVQLDIVDYGPVTVAQGYATFASQGSETANADTFVDVVGADLVYSFEVDYGYGFGFGPDSYFTDYSTTYVIAIDFEEDYYAGDNDLSQLLGGNPFAAWAGDNEVDVDVDGNFSALTFFLEVLGEDEPSSLIVTTLAVAGSGSNLSAEAQTEQGQVSIVAEALGVETLTSATGSIIEIEDQFSSVTGAVVAVA